MPDIAVLQSKFPAITIRSSKDAHLAVNIPASQVIDLLKLLRDEHGFDLLSDLTAVDWTSKVHPRFTVIWHLFSTKTHDYIRIAADCVDSEKPSMPSSTGLWPAANWHEREVYDLFGINFHGHPDLRRILMWETYPYHPLRKDFPLSGVETEIPDPEVVAVTGLKVRPAPLVGGPFVSPSGKMNMQEAEPSAKDESWNEKTPKPSE